MPLSKASRNGFRHGIQAVMMLTQRTHSVVMVVANAASFMSVKGEDWEWRMRIRRITVVMITLASLLLGLYLQ